MKNGTAWFTCDITAKLCDQKLFGPKPTVRLKVRISRELLRELNILRFDSASPIGLGSGHCSIKDTVDVIADSLDRIGRSHHLLALDISLYLTGHNQRLLFLCHSPNLHTERLKCDRPAPTPQVRHVLDGLYLYVTNTICNKKMLESLNFCSIGVDTSKSWLRGATPLSKVFLTSLQF